MTESLRTERLSGERMRASDLDDLARLFADPRVGATLGGTRTREETAAIVERQRRHWHRHGFGDWVFREPADGTFVGRGGLRRARLEGEPVVELAYALVPERWGRGLATEMARASLAVAFDALALELVTAYALPANRASRRVMEKCGFRYERDAVHAGLAHAVYRMSAEAWRSGSP